MSVDNNTKYRWEKIEKLDLPPETELTEYDFWLAYIRKYTKNILKNEDNGNKLITNGLDKKMVLIEQQINMHKGTADFITNVHDKLENINASQQKFIENALDLINKSPILIDYETKITLGGKDYHVTPKMKKVLTELSRISGWITAKELSVSTGESEAYICTSWGVLCAGVVLLQATNHQAKGSGPLKEEKPMKQMKLIELRT